MKPNNSNIKLLIKQPKYSILIICLLLSSISRLSQAQKLVLNYDFNDEHNLGLESGINDVDNDYSFLQSPSIRPINEHHDDISHHMIRFREPGRDGLEDLYGNGHVIIKSTKMADIFNLDPSGYTIITMVLIDNTFDDDYRKKIFQLIDTNGKTIFGLERYKQQLVFDRYVVSTGSKGSTIKNSWKFDLWNPVQFQQSSQSSQSSRRVQLDPYDIAISVTKNLIRVKVFGPEYTQKPKNPNVPYSCETCELVYLGGQVLTNAEIRSFGFGGQYPDKSIYAMDFFRVYSGAMSFADMDIQYDSDLKNNFQKSGNGNTKETLGVTPEESIFAMHSYPNPTSGKFILNFTLLNQDKIDYNLYSLDGREVLSNTGQVFGSGTHNLVIDASHLASGIYFLNVKSREHIIQGHKIIIE
jgi:hypothetical protein